jgi:hypothetical protein
METIDYHMKAIRQGLMLDTDDPNPAGFQAVLRHSEALHKLIQLSAINQERRRAGL